MGLEENLGTLYRKTRERFRLGGIENPGLEAAVIVCSVIGKQAQTVYTNPETKIGLPEIHECENRARRRLNREPCAYTTGLREFFSRGFSVSPAVLIPRPETETLVEAALEKIPCGKNFQVLDVGTGSGCIAVTLKKERPDISVTASDISARALEKAAQNARIHRAEVSFVTGDGLPCFEDSCADIVVSNPPYVSEEEFGNLPEEVRGFEPQEALLSGENGFAHIRKIICGSPRVLRTGGWCIIEVGDGQARKCSEIFRESGFSDISTAKDLCGKTRVVTANWKR